jgi:hypothetical protein
MARIAVFGANGTIGSRIAALEAMVDQLVAWSRALAPLRADAAAA